MKRIIFAYGGIAGAIIISFIIVSVMIWDPTTSHTANTEWVGYLIMIVALSLIFFGVKSYRDSELGGVIKFWEAVKVGLGITLVASVVYVAGWESYLNISDTDFMTQYADAYIEQLRADGASEQEIADAEAMMARYKEMYQNPFTRLGITFLEIFPVGLIITFISAGFLRKSTFLPSEEYQAES